MSRQRRLTSADVKPAKKGPHGGFPCRWCSAEVFPPRKTYCSDACVHEWRLRSDPAYVRTQLYLRDKGVCQSCGLNTQELRLMLWRTPVEERPALGERYGIPEYHARNLQLWEADHIVAVTNGGGLSGLSNYQTLCVPCHQAKTKADLGQE